jgi:hypothetical protein
VSDFIEGVVSNSIVRSQLVAALLLVALLAGLILLPVAQRQLRELRVRREARAMIRARFPMARSLPLSRADKRGFATGRDGVIRPR